MPNSITSDHQPHIATTYETIGGKTVNVYSHRSRESVTRLAIDVSNSQNTMTRKASKRPHSPTHENSIKLTSTSDLEKDLRLLAEAAVAVESHNIKRGSKFKIPATSTARDLFAERARVKLMGKDVNNTPSATSEIPFFSTQQESSGIPIHEIDSFVYESTSLAYMINDGSFTYSQKIIEYEWRLFEKIYREFNGNKKNKYPLSDKQVWGKIKFDLTEKYKRMSEKLLMWNAGPYQQGTDDARNITLKNVGMIKKELKHYLRQDLSFFLKTVVDK
ncbi:hypothetical protein [Erwinia tasmaniensis]|uniref:Uncharacterized protein n=1 Tax=Erwinia tasmaniensis (strain DSM 17950 / CFBP 7177 / CIP 109463 / NCPPB 4357 / Et1/99) TaxID=465817 RepID=B2VFS9_ERWT9|nr:hypothetical protein [Erwinia tasmaniensis]CAO97816.1 Hypothetical protein ETA_27700 [Erwinia tasmaniensis Et1/99]